MKASQVTRLFGSPNQLAIIHDCTNRKDYAVIHLQALPCVQNCLRVPRKVHSSSAPETGGSGHPCLSALALAVVSNFSATE